MKITNTLNANGFKVTGMADGTLPQDAITKNQLDNAMLGMRWKNEARVATTGNISLSGAQTIDGVSVIAGDRVLVKDQTTTSANGLYVASAGSWARSTDANTAALIFAATVFVSEGTANKDSIFNMTSDAPITLGTTSITWVKVNAAGGGGTYTQADGITISSNAISVTPGYTARKYTATIGDGSATTFTLTHNLNTHDVIVSARDVAANAGVLVDWFPISGNPNAIQVIFGAPPTASQYSITIAG